jgi:hypothetical protein
VGDVGQPQFSLLKHQDKYLKNENLSAFMNCISFKRFYLNSYFLKSFLIVKETAYLR